MTGGLEVDVTFARGPLSLAVAVAVAGGETLAVLGPNGAGKTTLLRLVAGLESPDTGRVALDGTVLDDVGAGVHVPTEQRSVGVVFQDGLLFPHLSAVENVAFGLRARGTARREARKDAMAWLARVGLESRAGARPAQLSGGQAQRVALARALVTHPRLLLLDEPLSALDASTRAGMRHELRRHLAEHDGCRVLVTHDPIDAFALADRIAIVEDGRIVQHGTTAEIAARPRSRYVADLVGVNLVRGVSHGGRVRTEGAELVAAGAPEGAVLALIHPRAVALHRVRPEGTPRNVWPGRVVTLEPLGDRARVQVDGALPVVAEVTAASVAALALGPGAEVWVSVKATEVDVYPA